LTGRIPTREFALYALGEPGPAAPAAPACPLPFSPARYSRYKYGSVAAAEVFAQALAAAVAERHPELACAPRLLMASSPYTYVPTAATTLARRLQPVLNAARARCGLPGAPLVQVDRVTPAAGDYGTLSASAREGRMAANALSFRRFPPGRVCGAHLLIVDDVRVTGAHQRCLMRASDELPLAARAFLYLASFGSPAGGGVDPPRRTRSTTPRSGLSMTWRESSKRTISPGTSASASSFSTQLSGTTWPGSWPGCPAGSSGTCTSTATVTATPG